MLNTQSSLFKKIKHFLKRLVDVKSKDEDIKQRGFVLNVLVLGSIVLALLATISTLINFLTEKAEYDGNPPLLLVLILIVFISIYLLSKRGLVKLGAHILIWVYFVPTLFTIYTWSIYITEALLTLALIIILSGFLISARFALLITFITSFSLFIITKLQAISFIPVDLTWMNISKPEPGDTIVVSAILMIIMTVSWLSHREIQRALKRALKSEKALKKERDLLEFRVEERTLELRLAQAEKLNQLSRFAEFGKSASGLFHDLVNPLTLISLNLKQLNKQIKQPELADAQVAIQRALLGTKRLESFITSARKRIRDQEVNQKFSLVEETHQAIQLLNHKIQKGHIEIRFSPNKDITITGNPIKFNQLVTNLVSNSIDAYDGLRTHPKIVEIRLNKKNSQIQLEIEDWGDGISPENLPKIFDPLFTTKDTQKGTGMGLAICKDIIEKNLKGTYDVKSQIGKGTLFTINFPNKIRS